MFKELIKIANELDSRGLTVEADALDEMIGIFIKKSSWPGWGPREGREPAQDGGEVIDLMEFKERVEQESPQNKIEYDYLIVFEDGETYDDAFGASVVKANPEQMGKIRNDEKVSDIIPEDHDTEGARWISVGDLLPGTFLQ